MLLMSSITLCMKFLYSKIFEGAIFNERYIYLLMHRLECTED